MRWILYYLFHFLSLKVMGYIFLPLNVFVSISERLFTWFPEGDLLSPGNHFRNPAGIRGCITVWYTSQNLNTNILENCF